MIRQLRHLIYPGHDPYENLALEQRLLETVEEDCSILFLWQNARTVVIGRNQCAWKECRIEALEQSGGHLARRQSGGGAVFHDLGNLNFTFLSHTTDADVSRQMEVILRACARFGIQGQVSGRNDLTVRDRKFSGSAFFSHQGRSFHHGTLLLEADTGDIVDFMHEEIKKRPMNRRRLLKQARDTVLIAVVFGIVSCIVFAILLPIINNILYPGEDTSQAVSLPEANPSEELSPEDLVESEREREATEGRAWVREELEGILDEQFIGVEQQKRISASLQELAEEKSGMIVTVSGITSDTDWFNDELSKAGIEDEWIFIDQPSINEEDGYTYDGTAKEPAVEVKDGDTVTIGIHVEAGIESWGSVDDFLLNPVKEEADKPKAEEPKAEEPKQEEPKEETPAATSEGLTNGSFEESDTSMWTIENIDDLTTQIDFQQKKDDAHTGEFALHFWGENGSKFKAYQKLSGLAAGKYDLSAAVEGGFSGDDKTQNIYLYCTVNGTEYKQTMTISEWAVWDEQKISSIDIPAGAEVEVGIYVEAGKQSWGTADDFVLSPAS